MDQDVADDGLNQLIDQLNLIYKSPRMFIVDYFDSIVNEIDMQIETILFGMSRRADSSPDPMRVDALNKLRDTYLIFLSSVQNQLLSQLDLDRFYDDLVQYDLNNDIHDLFDDLKRKLFQNKTILYLNLGNKKQRIQIGSNDDILNNLAYLIHIDDFYLGIKEIQFIK